MTGQRELYNRGMRLFLVDTPGLIFRAFYSIPTELDAPDGTPITGVFGTLRILRRMEQDYHPEVAALAFDEGKSFRDEIYAEYKAQRPEPPERIVPQFDLMRRAGKALHWPVYSIEGYEADDVIATLAKKAVERGDDVYVVTGDQDLLQLVRPGVEAIYTRQGITDVDEVDEEEFIAEWGFEPEKLTDYKALKGDSSDNIPGVSGIGDKSAKTLIDNFGTVENIFDNLDEVSGRYRKKLEGEKENVLTWKRLVTLMDDVPGVELPGEETRDGFEGEDFYDFVRELDMGSFLPDDEE